MPPVYNYKCEEHGLFSAVSDYDDRDSPKPCETCSEPSERTWEGHTVGLTKASYIDGNNRFDKLKKTSAIKKEVAKQRQQGNLQEANKIKKELKKL